MARLNEFLQNGYLTFAGETAVRNWIAAALPAAREAVRDPASARWLRCGGTWFVGVDALPNDMAGRVGAGPPLAGAAWSFITEELGLSLPLHRAQVSVCYPGYPRPSAGESDTAFAFRLKRDAAHVDGLLAEDNGKRRFLREPHAYVLGLTLTEQSSDASPLTVWEGSHHIMCAMFSRVLGAHPPRDWPAIDLVEPYKQARSTVFTTCRRVEIATPPGSAVLLHRHLVHGVAPWGRQATASEDGRMIAYFRPELAEMANWLLAP